MHWPPDIADDLPAPRDDEPASLRQDIADELADHLQCAFTRELHVMRDEQAAQEKALDRFGDPRAIARKLWFDALRDKIMSQRLTFVALVVVLLASLGSTAATWFVVEQGRRASEAMLAGAREANEALVAESRETNAALLAKLSELSTSAAAEPKSLEWNPVKVRLYSGEKPGVPATDFKVSLSGHVLDTSKSVSITRTTDATGVADFGLVRPGEHNISVSAPWNESLYRIPLYVLPGNPVLEEIQCPASDLPKTDVRFEVEWPDDLKARGCWLVCQLNEQPRIIDGRTWTRYQRASEHFFLLDPATQIVPFPFLTQSQRSSSGQALPWPFQQLNSIPFDIRGLRPESPRATFARLKLGNANPGNVGGSQASRQISEPFEFLFQSADSMPKMSLTADEYRLEAMLIADTPREFSMQSGWELTPFGLQWQQQAGQERPTGESMVPLESFAPESRGNLMSSRILGGLLPGGIAMRNMPGGIPNTYRPLTDWITPPGGGMYSAEAQERMKAQPRFVAEAGKLNVWKITLPESLLEKVRGNPDFKSAEAEVKDADPPKDQGAERFRESLEE